MVAILSPGRYLREAFYYNENKVKEGVAEYLHAENYPHATHSVTEFERLHMLEKMAAINPGIEVNSLHISLNFDPSEAFSKEKLVTIAREYMEGLGFGNQPYLVYQHHDSGHPHLHVLTTNVQADGTPISLHQLANRKSEPTRKALEKKYGLVVAEGRRQQPFELTSAYTSKVEYGKLETKRAIGLVLKRVLETYKFTSLPELNAVLKLYNVMADRGSENSRIYQNRGLVYRILDDAGKPVGVPVKASLFYNKPTLSDLEKRFLKNDIVRQNSKAATRNAIDAVLRKHPQAGLDAVIDLLGKQGVDVVLRQSKEGHIYGITYVDHKARCVFNGSVLGKDYSAKGFLERCNTGIAGGGQLLKNKPLQEATDGQEQAAVNTPRAAESSEDTTVSSQEPGLLEIMTRAEETYSYVPYDWRKKKKKKRKGLSR